MAGGSAFIAISRCVWFGRKVPSDSIIDSHCSRERADFWANQTHRLIAMNADPPATGRVGDCQCDAGIRDYAPLLLDRLSSTYTKLALEDAGRPHAAEVQHAAGRRFAYSRLEPLQDVDPNSPFLMLQVDGQIIGGHSDIFNQRIVDFMIEFFVLSETKRISLRVRPPAPFVSKTGSLR